MKERTIIHVVDADVRARAHAARIIFELGHHAEVYAGLGEFCEQAPQRGIVLVRDEYCDPGFDAVIDLLHRSGVWLPVIAMADNPSTERVVTAIKCGALEYAPLPLDRRNLSTLFDRLGDEIRARGEAVRSLIEARSRIDSLSAREREVLDWLSQGSSNKSIARELNISPRTVEIHRANMMSKLGAHSTVDAVRLRLDAKLETLAN